MFVSGRGFESRSFASATRCVLFFEKISKHADPDTPWAVIAVEVMTPMLSRFGFRLEALVGNHVTGGWCGVCFPDFVHVRQNAIRRS